MVINDEINDKLFDCFRHYLKSIDFFQSLCKLIGLILILIEFTNVSTKIKNDEVEHIGHDFCFVFFTENIIVGLCLQLPLVLDIHKLSKSFDTLDQFIELVFNKEKNVNKFVKLKTLLKIVRILSYQIVSLIVFTCFSSILFKSAKNLICDENMETIRK